MAISIIQLDPLVPAGQFTDLLPDARLVRFDQGEALPQAGDLGALIVLGGRQNAYDPTLAPVAELLREATAAKVPLLGICLGAQLLATAHGGRVEVDAPAGPERGIVDIRTRPGAERDPILGAVIGELGTDFAAVSMHNDAVTDLPDGATWLAASRQYPFQAFRLGSALGVQFHPEVDRTTYGQWLEREEGVDPAVAQAHWAEREGVLTALATAVAGCLAVV